MDWEDAAEQCDLIVDLIDNEVPDWALDKCAEFFESVREKAVDIGESIAKRKSVTPRQAKALDNMESGVRRWMGDQN